MHKPKNSAHARANLESYSAASVQARASRSHLQDSALASTVSHVTEPGSWSLTADLNAAINDHAWNRGRWSRTADGRSGQISLYVKPSVHGKSVANGRWPPTAEVANGRFDCTFSSRKSRVIWLSMPSLGIGCSGPLGQRVALADFTVLFLEKSRRPPCRFAVGEPQSCYACSSSSSAVP